MARRNKQQQSKHDRKVAEVARDLEREGWKVRADLPGRDEPDPIGGGGHVPDIVATKAGAKRIIEVETADTVDKDQNQHAAFRRSAGQQKRTSFTIEEA